MVPGQQSDSRQGLIAAVSALLIWGLYPFYFVAAIAVPPTEMLAHRVVWSLPFGLLVIGALRQFPSLLTVLRKPRTVAILALGSVLLAMNWGLYIYAVQIEQIFQASLGYYINPLLNVLVGVVFFSERLSRIQGMAIGLAAIGVAALTIYGGQFPVIALVLTATFGAYTVIRKMVDVPAMSGLMVEILVLVLPAIAYMLWLKQSGALVFGSSTSINLLMYAAGPLTIVPLVFFAFAARNIRLSTLGVLQFIGPTMQFACGLYLGEPFTRAHALCFGFIWVGVALFAFDSLRANRRASAR